MNALAGLSALVVLGLVPAAPEGESIADRLLPRPQRLEALGGELRIIDDGAPAACIVAPRPSARAIALGVRQLNDRLVELGGEALPVLSAEAAAGRADTIVWLGTRDDLSGLRRLLHGRSVSLPDATDVPDGYLLECIRVPGRHVVACVGQDERGCYYALQTLLQLLHRGWADVEMPRVRIADWPAFRLRLVKVSATRCDPDVVARYAELLQGWKINLFALQYHRESDGTWREPSARYRQVIERVGRTAREGGVLEPGLFVCPYFPPRLDATRPEDVQAYLQRLRWGLELGFRWVEVDFNDWARWDRLSDAERARFDDAGSYMAHLTNAVYEALRREFPRTGIIVCPMIGWYHGRAREGLATLCQSIPEDVLVYWTGPQVRSRHITGDQLREWTETTGRKPFLWDNTIYAHFQPYWVGYAFNAYQNAFPEELRELLAGPGIHLNATATPHYLPGIMTFADFMWNPDAYDPHRSIRNALRLCWGEDAPDAANEVQQHLIALRRHLYEAKRGWVRFNRRTAERMVDELERAVERLGEVAADPRLTQHLKSTMVAEARSDVVSFEPPDKLRPRPPVTPRPLADGVVNGSVEELADGSPVGWSLYRGAGGAELVVSDDAHSGRHSACLHATEWYHNPEHPMHGDRRWINVALIHGSEEGGMHGTDAYDVQPETTYRCSFYLKSDAPSVAVEFQGWSEGFAAGNRHLLRSKLSSITPTGRWQRYEATFTTWFDTRKFALKIGLQGYADEAMRLGRVWVDDVAIAPAD
ncbi:MAG: beta-N-acetylglucosaminidase domain-containing protein [Armatimonadota bacterium]|nr:beta-N-acetylglucosaminidase domain-containing protein [Armatimonadota bacterium]